MPHVLANADVVHVEAAMLSVRESLFCQGGSVASGARSRGEGPNHSNEKGTWVLVDKKLPCCQPPQLWYPRQSQEQERSAWQ